MGRRTVRTRGSAGEAPRRDAGLTPVRRRAPDRSPAHIGESEATEPLAARRARDAAERGPHAMNDDETPEAQRLSRRGMVGAAAGAGMAAVVGAVVWNSAKRP